jgi:hypothetical protein
MSNPTSRTQSRVPEFGPTHPDGRQAIRSSDESYDTVRAEDVWKHSVQLTAQLRLR